MSTKAFTANRFLFVGAIFLSVTAGLVTAIAGSPWFCLVGAACILLGTLFFKNLNWGAWFLLLTSVCTAYSVDVGPVTVRPDQVVTLVLAAILFVFLISGKRPAITTTLDWFILSYLLINLLSSLLHSPDVRTSLQKCVLLAITFSSYFVATQTIRTRAVLSRIISLLIVLGIVEAIYGIVSVYLFTTGYDIGGAQSPYGDIYARGTFVEGNIFGSFEMMIALILISFLFSMHFRARRGIILIALVIVLVATIMSFTRAAWLGLLAGFLAYVLFIRRQLTFRVFKNFPLILSAILLLSGAGYMVSASVMVGRGSLLDAYIERFQNIVNYQTTTSGTARLLVWKESIRLWQRNPILGNGTDSIKALAAGNKIPKFGTEYWIPNSMILALHDTGIIGLAFFCSIQILFLMKLWVVMRRTESTYCRAVLEGLFSAFVGVQVAYFFTNAFWLVYIWLFMAIGISCCRIAMQSGDMQAPV
jgi:putative inorganic carbon (hco3(-)) transporter